MSFWEIHFSKVGESIFVILRTNCVQIYNFQMTQKSPIFSFKKLAIFSFKRRDVRQKKPTLEDFMFHSSVACGSIITAHTKFFETFH